MLRRLVAQHRPLFLAIEVVLSTIAVYIFLLMFIAPEINQPFVTWWTGAWLLGLVFAGWNSVDAVIDTWSVMHPMQSTRNVAGAFWLMRSEMLKSLACLCMASAGVIAMFLWGSIEIRVLLLCAGGLCIVVNEIGNRVDRERIEKMPPSSRAARMEQLAVEIAGLGRSLGHIANNLAAVQVGTLEDLQRSSNLTNEQREDIEAVEILMMSLADELQAVHQRIRDLDPSKEGVMS